MVALEKSQEISKIHLIHCLGTRQKALHNLLLVVLNPLSLETDMDTLTRGMLTTTDTQSTQTHSKLTTATHLYDCVVFPVTPPNPTTRLHTFSSVQPSLLSIYKHPEPLTGLSVCTTTGGGGKEYERGQRKREKTGFGMREDIRACKFIQWLERRKSEDKRQ